MPLYPLTEAEKIRIEKLRKLILSSLYLERSQLQRCIDDRQRWDERQGAQAIFGPRIAELDREIQFYGGKE